MKVPVYNPQVAQQGLPNVQQNIRVSADNFLSFDKKLALNVAGQVAGDLEKVALSHYQEQVKQAQETRVLDARNQFEQYRQEKLFHPESGALTRTGKSAFEPINGRNPTDLVFEDLTKKQNELAGTLGNDEQRALFNQHAQASLLDTKKALWQHEGQQHRVYQSSTNIAGIETSAKAVELNYTDPNVRQQSFDEIRRLSVAQANLHGQDEAYGLAQADKVISSTLQASINAALQHPGGDSAAQELLNQHGDIMDANDRSSAQNKIGDSFSANLLQSDPKKLQDLTGVNAIERGILKAEGGKDNFDANGQPAVSSDGKSIGLYQVTDATAKDPGFGIAPAKERTHAEYNRIGKQLIAKLTDKYHGDPEKVAAAYNAGSGAVDSAISKGGANWQDFIPASTKNAYLPRMLDGMKTGTPVDYMSETDRLQKYRAATAQIEHGRQVYAVQLQDTVKNQFAQAATTGITGDLIPFSTFQAALGDKAETAFADYHDELDAQKQYFSIAKMPLQQVNETLAASEPTVGSPDYSRELKQFEQLKAAFNAADKIRRDDPILWAMQNDYPIQSINWDKPSEEIGKRATVAKQLSEQYGVSETILSKQEADSLSKVLDEGALDDQVKVLQSLRDGLREPDLFHATVNQLRKNSPSTIVAAHIIGESTRYDDALLDGTETARSILRGEKLLNPGRDTTKTNGKGSGITLPTDFNTSFYAQIGDATGGDMTTAGQLLNAAKAYYADNMDKSSKTMNYDLFNKSVQAVTGGLFKHAEKNVIPPYGMTEQAFIHAAFQQFNQQTGELLSVFNKLPLELVGNGVYRVKNGANYLLGKNGFVTIDLNSTPIDKPMMTSIKGH